jgi:hypothetical protein
MRIVLLMANGAWLLILVVGLLLANIQWSFPMAIPLVLFSTIMAGNFFYIWRFPPQVHNEKGPTHRVREPLG